MLAGQTADTRLCGHQPAISQAVLRSSKLCQQVSHQRKQCRQASQRKQRKHARQLRKLAAQAELAQAAEVQQQHRWTTALSEKTDLQEAVNEAVQARSHYSVVLLIEHVVTENDGDIQAQVLTPRLQQGQ